CVSLFRVGFINCLGFGWLGRLFHRFLHRLSYRFGFLLWRFFHRWQVFLRFLFFYGYRTFDFRNDWLRLGSSFYWGNGLAFYGRFFGDLFRSSLRFTRRDSRLNGSESGVVKSEIDFNTVLR